MSAPRLPAVHGTPQLTVDIRRKLDRFTLQVSWCAQGRATGIFGPSGAGKTTLLEAIAGLDRRAQGVIRLDQTTAGDVVEAPSAAFWLDSARGVCLPTEQRGIGYVPQDGLLFPHFDVRRNLLAGARRASEQGVDITNLFDSVTDLLELRPLLRRPAPDLSGGERQRVALGRALMSGPRILLLDEPLASLDLGLRRRILPLLVRVRDEMRIPLLFVSHEPTEVQALCDDVLVLDRGQVVAEGPTHEVLTKPEVFPLAAARRYETVLEVTVLAPAPRHSSGPAVADREDGASVVFAGTDIALWTPPPHAAPGTRLWVGIPADDVILARDPPTLLSARNRIPAVVHSIEAVDGRLLIRARVSARTPPIAVLLTHAAREELALRPGDDVYLIIKANACALYEQA